MKNIMTDDDVQLSFKISMDEKETLMRYARQTRRSMTKVIRDYIYDIQEKIRYEKD